MFDSTRSHHMRVQTTTMAVYRKGRPDEAGKFFYLLRKPLVKGKQIVGAAAKGWCPSIVYALKVAARGFIRIDIAGIAIATR